MNLDQIRKDFPVLSNFTYLNTASSGILHQDIFSWRQDLENQFLEGGSVYRETIINDLHSVKVQVAKTFGSEVQRVSLISNFSIGSNGVFESLSNKLKVLTIQGDYPSLTLPIKSRGFEVFDLPLFMLSEAGIAEAIKDQKIDLLAVSLTQWSSGFHLKVDFFQRLKIDFPDLIIICDGTQYLGTGPFHFDGSGIDILITSAYKWLLSGYGCGFMMFSKAILNQMDIKYIGNNTVMTRGLLETEYKSQLFEPGHQDFLAFGTMRMALRYLDNLGLDKIEKQISKVSLHTKTQLVQMGMLSPITLGGAVHRNIIHFLGSERLVEFLRSNKILISYRQGIRISIHFYNSEEDVNQCLKAIRIFR